MNWTFSAWYPHNSTLAVKVLFPPKTLKVPKNYTIVEIRFNKNKLFESIPEGKWIDSSKTVTTVLPTENIIQVEDYSSLERALAYARDLVKSLLAGNFVLNLFM